MILTSFSLVCGNLVFCRSTYPGLVYLYILHDTILLRFS